MQQNLLNGEIFGTQAQRADTAPPLGQAVDYGLVSHLWFKGAANSPEGVQSRLASQLTTVAPPVGMDS
jgi:hypothetical protein